MSFYRYNRLLTCTILFSCLVLAQMTPAQDQSQKTKISDNGDRLGEVRFNLSVRDGAGKPLDNIKAEDLKIFENDKEQKITYFAKKAPLSLGLVIDNTFSLQSQLPLIKALTKWFGDKLNPEDEAFVVRFVSSDKINVAMDWTSDKALLSKTADQFYTEGGSTAFIDGLYLSAEKIFDRMKKDNSRRYALILISDCEDRDSYYKMTDLYKKMEGIDLQIFIIALVNQLDDRTMTFSEPRRTPHDRATKRAQEIAEKTGGIAFFPESDKEKRYITSPAAEAIMTELRSQYMIGYIPTDKKTDDKKRNLNVEVSNDAKGEKRTAKARDGFFLR